MREQSPFLCPVCGKRLTEEEKTLFCPSGHSFDKAKQGYVNLLISNKKGVHGDDKLMVRSRRAFLEKGYYSELRSKISGVLGSGQTVLDAGCGEGYYTSLFAENNTVCGIDVSKEALKLAAKKCPSARFAVASVYEIPLEDEKTDALISIFAPDGKSEFLRVLRRGGRLITVTPAEDHLIELKNAVYEKPYRNTPSDPERPGFSVLSQTRVGYSADIASNGDVLALFAMTPYFYNTSPSDRKKLDGINGLKVTLDFLITEYEKK